MAITFIASVQDFRNRVKLEVFRTKFDLTGCSQYIDPGTQCSSEQIRRFLPFYSFVVKNFQKTKPLHCANGQGRVSYWLNSFGQDPSEFSVILQSAETGAKLERFGPFGPSSLQQWDFYQFDFDLTTENFITVFEFTCGGFKGDIGQGSKRLILLLANHKRTQKALDDIQISCGLDSDSEHLHDFVGSVTSEESVCTGELSESMTCNFDDSRPSFSTSKKFMIRKLWKTR